MASVQVRLPTARAPLPLPRELYIESTTRCNEFCDQCPRTHLGREADRDIAPDEVRRIVEQIPDLERVVLHGLGEPLLNTRLPEIIALLRERHIGVLFNSNGLLLNEKRGRALITAGLSELRISLDGATPGTYARIRGVNQRALPLIIRNLTAFERLKQEMGAEHPRTSIWFTAMRENFHELAQVVEIAAQTGIREVYVQRFIYFGKGLAREDQAIYRQRTNASGSIWPGRGALCGGGHSLHRDWRDHTCGLPEERRSGHCAPSLGRLPAPLSSGLYHGAWQRLFLLLRAI